MGSIVLMPQHEEVEVNVELLIHGGLAENETICTILQYVGRIAFPICSFFGSKLVWVLLIFKIVNAVSYVNHMFIIRFYQSQ